MVQVDILTLAITTTITGAVGWAIKTLLDTLKGYISDSTKWRGSMDRKMDALTDATQTTMRTQLIHYAQKFIARGWITAEERASWQDMYDKYSALNANGLIEGYHERIKTLPEGTIE